ncbi:prominin-1-A-like isoform X2 [Brienomyrus brachyistius]|uniref:prominin-1-A-like isoform X2 n=1 Tax=Brienomyrus brachyistius TaxID=42636 RepID=UPI0020B37024|nr:prominin-1-A-like isoform X2 [Brienomyrus brachyistius]
MVVKVVLPFLLCWGVISGQPQATTQQGDSGALQFGSVPPGVYETLASYEPGPMGALFYMVNTFLHVVQPNPFPEDIIVQLVRGDLQSQYSKAAHYEMGFLVCAALGVLFMVLMPLVGFCFCVCRCCENCGGEMHQRQKKNANCRRSALAGALFVTSLLITAGVVIAYAANQNLSNQLKGVRRLVNSNMKDLQTFVNQTPVQIDYLIGQYTTTERKVISDLENVGPLLGREVRENLASECLPALAGVSSMASDMWETQRALLNMNQTLEVLQNSSKSLQANLSLVNSSINDALRGPFCKDNPANNVCTSIRDSLSQLCIHANFSRLASVNQQLSKVNDVLQTNLSSIVQKGYASFNDIPDLVKNQTKSTITGVQNHLDGISTDITNFSNKLHLQAILKNFSNYVSHVHSLVEDVYPQIDRADFYRWTCCVTLCCLVLLILTFTFLGLLCGGCGYDRHASPTTRGCVSNTGGNLLMAGAGFTFIFSWLLMVFVSLTFVIGGNMEKLVCEPFESQQLFKVIDTLYLSNPDARNFIPALLNHNAEVNLTVESLYSKCKENRGIYSALQLDNVFNLTGHLDMSAHMQDISKEFNSVNVDLNSIILLDPSGKANLLSFNQTGVDKINYPEYLAEVNKSITVVDLLLFADNLEKQLTQLPSGALKSSLTVQVSRIRDIYYKQVIPMQNSTTTLSQSVQRLQNLTSNLPSRIAGTLTVIDGAQKITHNATHIITQETGIYRDRLIGYFQQYINWVKTSLAMDVASCKPFSNVMDSVDLVACSFVVDSLNLFWFGLGWATVLLLPSLILSVRLAKFYRRMDTEDVYDDMEIGINGYHNELSLSVQSTVPMSEMVPEPLHPYPCDPIPPGFSSSMQDRLVRVRNLELKPIGRSSSQKRRMLSSQSHMTT